ncbi:glycoprotein-N-acetylgalactosamine 3-beta-galactosyltransferase 1-like isoform X2 [Eriocheir sinensis]|nr:glycoprotein-N-acetylgalactosamine 3-beta-galactosyltransferase 1-like isoform X2 [Eriocheir sinensis]
MLGTRRNLCKAVTTAMLVTLFLGSFLVSPTPPKSPRTADEEEVRIVCWAVTAPKYHETRSRAVKETWARHCDQHFFVSTKPDTYLGTLVVNVTENYWMLWGKTRAAIRHAYENYREAGQWFIKADDDTFVIVENLKNMLKLYDHRKPLYFGNKFQMKNISQGFMGGGAGYVLSRAAVKLLVEKGFPNKTACHPGPKGREDVELGKCLEAVGVVAGDSRDHLGRDRFMSFTPDLLQERGALSRVGHSWFWTLVYYPTSEGPLCCSDTAVTFHYVSPAMMRALYYLVYVLRLARPHDPAPLLPPSLNASLS